MNRLVAACVGVLVVVGTALSGCSGSAQQSPVSPSPSRPGAGDAVVSPSKPVADTQRKNNVDLVISGQPGVSASFTWNGQYSISPDQASTWGGVSNCTAGPGAQCVVTIDAGRQGSSAVGQWWSNQGIQAGVFTVGVESGNNWNFAIMGTLSVTRADGTTNQYPVGFAQYYAAGNNDWIMGGAGTGWVQQDGNTRTMVTLDGVVAVTANTTEAFAVTVS